MACIYSSKPQPEWFLHPEFQQSLCSWIDERTGQPFQPKLFSNKSGRATNKSGVLWLEWMLSN